MKIINAIWEIRNLGVETIEINVDVKDSTNTVIETLKKLKAEYIVVKIPSTRKEFQVLMFEQGYCYIEDMVLLINRLQSVQRNPVFERLYQQVAVCLMDDKDLEKLFVEIEKGLFSTDRISIDPYFSPKQAARRYIGWIQDEIERGTSLYKYIFKEKSIGFFGLKEKSDRIYTSFLGGIYPEYRKGGVGAIVKVPEVVKSLGGKRVETKVSFNNMVQIRSLLMNGYTIEESYHTFIKHNK